MAFFDRKPQIINGEVLYSPKDLSSVGKILLVIIKVLQMGMVAGAACVVAGALANMIRMTFDFLWSWEVFFMWGIVAGFLSIITIAIEFLSWWWITDNEAQRYRDYYDHVESQMEEFMNHRSIEHNKPDLKSTNKDKTPTDGGAKIIHLPRKADRKKPTDENEPET